MERWIAAHDVGRGEARCEIIEHDGNHDASATNARLTVANTWIDRDVLSPVHARKVEAGVPSVKPSPAKKVAQSVPVVFSVSCKLRVRVSGALVEMDAAWCESRFSQPGRTVPLSWHEKAAGCPAAFCEFSYPEGLCAFGSVGFFVGVADGADVFVEMKAASGWDEVAHDDVFFEPA